MMKALTWAACERLIRCLPRSSGTKNGGIPGESERGWRDLRRAIPMLNHQAAVLDEWNGGVGGEFHCLGGADAALQPDPLGTDCDGFTDDTGAMLRCAAVRFCLRSISSANSRGTRCSSCTITANASP